jgi:phosphoglycolate phosphatase
MDTMKFDNVQAVLFDLDGTLIDSAPDLGAAVDKMHVDRGLSSLPLSSLQAHGRCGRSGYVGLGLWLERQITPTTTNSKKNSL